MDKYYQFGFWFLYLAGMYPTYEALMHDDRGKVKLGNAFEGVMLVLAVLFWWITSPLMMIAKVNDG